MEDAGIDQTTTDPLDELTAAVRKSLQWARRPLEDLEGYDDLPRGELESILAGTRSVSPLTALVVSHALGCLAQDIHLFGEQAVDDAFATLPPSVRQQAQDEFWGGIRHA